ncbi:hypothetical protein COB55_02695 [Candidatus Wolfebacteria bacterium]|nr:MAG: hypothetical protein COB55_02695 [Candidatus Wolfebacteria bacterium]
MTKHEKFFRRVVCARFTSEITPAERTLVDRIVENLMFGADTLHPGDGISLNKTMDALVRTQTNTVIAHLETRT